MKLRLASAVAVCALLSGAAMAQTPNITKAPPAGGFKVPVLTYDPAKPETVSLSSAVDSSTVTMPGQYPATGALSSFRLEFTNGDHKINTIGVLSLIDRAEFGLADQDANDSFRASASWLQSRHFKSDKIVVTGGGEFAFDLPKGPANHTPVLQGFRFDRKVGKDANVRLVVVQITPDNKQVRVALADDQGADFRGLETNSGVAFGLAFVPFGIMASAPMVTTDVAHRFSGNELGPTGLRQFQAIVEITWVPNAMILGSGSVGGGARAVDSGRLPSPNDKVALRGFRMFFGNSDHHLLGVGLDLRNPQAPLFYQDNDADDPVIWSADWVKVK